MTSSNLEIKIEQNNLQKDFAFMVEYEEQDNLIQEGISLICHKITECIELLFADNHNK